MPQTILPVLCFLLFFPPGILYTGIIVFLLSVLASGDLRGKWQTAKASPLFWPVVVMFGTSCLLAVFTDRSADKFWSGLAHYQIYFFLLLFISIGPGAWQPRAAKVFLAGALVASTLFYLNLLHLLPRGELLASYIVYNGNKSILLGILLAIAGGGLFHEMIEHADRQRLIWQIPSFLYISVALLFLAQTRTGSLIFVVLCALVLLKQIAVSWRRSFGILTVLAVMMAASWQLSPALQARATQTIDDIQAFSEGKETSGDGVRLEMYGLTAQMVAEKPLIGHGIGAWLPLYQQRAAGMATGTMTTPHNDYLLYAAEIGLIGLAILLWTWITQLVVARKVGGVHGMWLTMLTVTLIIGGMFNAILRDSVFGMAFMVLLAIPLAGVRRGTAAA